jgi:CheY-like chemotaxis protein
MKTPFKKKKLCVLWVDDIPKDIESAVDLLNSSQLIDVQTFTDYSALLQDKRLIDKADLLILDVLMPDGTTDFERCVEYIAGKKPFIVYTILPSTGQLQLSSGGVQVIREWALKRGGLATIPKGHNMDYKNPESRTQIEYNLVEKILGVYWCRR